MITHFFIKFAIIVPIIYQIIFFLTNQLEMNTTKNLSIREKTRGALLGYAIGDALGLGTEFMNRREIKVRYPRKLTRYDQIVRDAYRSQWKRGATTNVTKLVELLINSILECDGFNYTDYARKLKEWYQTDPIDLPANMRWLLSQKDYLMNPLQVAQRVWKSMNSDENPSDGLGRSLFMGLLNENVAQNAVTAESLTHPQPRCQGNAEIIAVVANSLMWRNEDVPFEELVAIAKRHDPTTVKYLEIAHDGILADFHLDNESTYWYVRKAMGCALWALWHCKDPNEALLAVTNHGGGADTNASLATGLVALKYGYSSIDTYYIENLSDHDHLINLADRYSAFLDNKFGAK